MKYLLIFILLGVLLLLLYRRLRPYIASAQQMLGLLRDVRRMGQDSASEPPSRTGRSSTDKLIRCASCATWIPAARAFKADASGAPYCSPACLESSLETVKRKRASNR